MDTLSGSSATYFFTSSPHFLAVCIFYLVQKFQLDIPFVIVFVQRIERTSEQNEKQKKEKINQFHRNKSQSILLGIS